MKRLLLLLTFVITTQTGFAQNKIFWSDTQKSLIAEYDLDTETVTELVRGPGDIRANAMALDTVNARVFWVTRSELRMGNLISGETTTLYELPSSGSDFDIEYNYATDAVFVSELEDQAIYRYDLASETGVELLTSSEGVGFPNGVFTTSTTMYWSTINSILQANLDGSNPRIFVGFNSSIRPSRFAVDEANDWLYFNNAGSFFGDPELIRVRISDPNIQETLVEFNSDDEYAEGLAIHNEEQKLYWINRLGELRRVDLDGQNVELVRSGLIESRNAYDNLEIDEESNIFYWSGGTVFSTASDSSGTPVFSELNPTAIRFAKQTNTLFYLSDGVISRYNTDNKQTEELLNIAASNFNVSDFLIDEGDSSLFWFDLNNIYRSSFDGDGIDTLLRSPNITGVISGFAIDEEQNTLYFTDNASTSFGNLKSIHTDGSAFDTLVSLSLNFAANLTIDPVSNTLFWREGNLSDSAKIIRSDLSGQQQNVIVTALDDGIQNPATLVAEAQTQKLYWTDANLQQIWRSNLDGSDAEALGFTQFEGLFGLAVVGNTGLNTEEFNSQPRGITLSQNYPNPFNPTTSINYSLDQQGFVSLTVFNVMGQNISTLVNQQQSSGNYTVSFDASRLASGIYYYRLETGGNVLTKQMTLIK